MESPANHSVPMGWTIGEWQEAYRSGSLAPSGLLEWVERLEAADVAWISVATPEQVSAQLSQLERRLAAAEGQLERLPLYGVPFAVKDNIDVAGWDTTAACPEFAYRAEVDAPVVAQLVAAGAIVVGKTNLDQFATGLAGNRSPYGAVPNPFDPRYVAGGSSSGSASVVARGLVPFSLGTDTAGSGRVPAGFNDLVGLKPTRGRVSTRGVVPACRTLDCVSVFALTVTDAEIVAGIIDGYDPEDPYARRPRPARRLGAPWRLAVPAQLEFYGDERAAAAFARDRRALEALGAELVPIDFGPFLELARLLYGGPWVAERHLVVAELLERAPAAVHPTVRELLQGVGDYSARDQFRAEYERARLTRRIHVLLDEFDALVVPTAPRFFRLDEVEADPIGIVTRLGHYTNFANLGDLCGIAVPGRRRDDGLPAGFTLLAPAWQDAALIELARVWEAQLGGTLAATGRPRAHVVADGEGSTSSGPRTSGPSLVVAVVGAHLRGMPLNHQLTDRGARFLEATRTAARYRLYALQATQPAKPGLLRGGSGSIEVELWTLPLEEVGSFLAEIPPPLGIGSVELADGRWVKGFLCEPHALEGALDITALGGWRPYVAGARPADA